MANAERSANAHRSYLVTGASTGIGRACVDELVRRQAHVWTTVRTSVDAADLHQAYGDRVSVLRMELTDPDSIAEMGRTVCERGPLHGLINNAGVVRPAPLEYVPLDVFREQLEVNVVGQLAVTQALLPALRAARAVDEPARVAVVGSVVGRIAGPIIGPYHASKFAVVGMTDALRAELAPSGIKVILIEPGAVATPIWERGAETIDKLRAGLPPEGELRYGRQLDSVKASAARSALRGRKPELVGALVARAITSDRPRPRYLSGLDARGVAILSRLPYPWQYRLTAARG